MAARSSSFMNDSDNSDVSNNEGDSRRAVTFVILDY